MVRWFREEGPLKAWATPSGGNPDKKDVREGDSF